MTIDIRPVPLGDNVPEPPGDDEADTRFTKPAPLPPARTLALAEAQRREDDPPPDVPRDQWDRPLIVTPDGSGCAMYLRASKLGKLIRDPRVLVKWDERNIVYGMSRSHHLVVRAQGVRTLTTRPDMAVLEDVAGKAKILAGADAGAMTGSGMHALHARRAAGEDLSWLDPTTLGCLDAITALLDPRVFEILATEGDDDLGRTFVVHDGLRAAGSFDLVVRLLVDLTWPDGITISAGTILVVDLKTGKITSGPYWDTEFTCQQLIYAEGTPYRPGVTTLADPKVRSVKNVTSVTDQPGDHGRISWAAIGVPERPCQRWSLILHVPALSPGDAHWERVDLDEAREDARVARDAWDRDKVSRARRFLALPAAALPVPPDGPIAVTTSVDGMSVADGYGDAPALDVDDTEQLPYNVPVSPPDAGSDRCAACGVSVPRGLSMCTACDLRRELTGADSTELLETLWIAHGPTGDGVWADEHSVAAQAAYDRLVPEIGPGGPPIPPDDAPEPEPQQPETDAGPPFTDADSGDTFLAARCRRCVHRTEDDDPCEAFTPAYVGEWPGILHRVPISEENPVGVECERFTVGEPPDAGPFQGPDDDPAGPPAQTDAATCPEHGPYPDAIMCPGCIERHRATTAVGQQAAAEATYTEQPEPGPFDDTTPLADLRNAIGEALTEDTLIALYEAHKPVEDGGDGLWDDECTVRAQARYDALSSTPAGPEGAPS